MSWQTRRFNNSTKYLLFASMTTFLKRKKRNLLENCQKYALNLFFFVKIWRVLEDLVFCGQ